MPRSTETSLLPGFATARSGLPSAFRSPMATDLRSDPTAKLAAGLKAPVPIPKRTETLLLSRFATARSGLPSPLRSPMATERGRVPTAKLAAGSKAPAPLPRRTETLLLVWFATARSGLPSPLRSPMARESGFVPAAKIVAGAEGAGAGAQEGRDVVAEMIRHGQVELAVAVEVADGDGLRVRPHCQVRGGAEGHRLSQTDSDGEKGRYANSNEP